MVTPQQFLDYLEEWDALERAYYHIPDWRHIKKMRNIKTRQKLTKDFERLLDD